MIIALVSDTHDNLVNIQKALEIINQKKAEALIHCGDLCAPFVLKELMEKFSGPIYLTFGNNDADEFILTEWTFTIGKNAKFHKPMGELELGGKKIAFTHYTILGQALASTQKYDLVVFGHSHEKKEERISKTLLVNPGALCGQKWPVSFAFYDSETNQVTFESF